MDNLSSPTSISSSTPTAPSSATKQPTYTTAGTLWNPSASQPLQPPTRRGRSFKWTLGGPHSDLALLPKSVLASLPLKSSGSRAPSFHRYSPLQQNYDRAVSPFGDRDHQLATMSPQMPRMRSSNTQAPLVSLISQLDKDKIAEGNASEGDDEAETGDEDDDSDFNMNPLLNMTVKSLNNLASYPNPNQRRAQKALYGRIKPTVPGHGLANRASAPSSPPPPRIHSPVFSKEGHVVKPMLPTAQSDSSLLRQDNLAVEPERDGHFLADKKAGFWPARETRGGFPSMPTSQTPGPGAPRPLTAGPPGQRQYRPSTFESTFRALHNNTTVQTPSTDDEDAVMIARQTMLQAGIDDVDLAEDTFLSPLGIHMPSSPAPFTSQSFGRASNSMINSRLSFLTEGMSNAETTSGLFGSQVPEAQSIPTVDYYNSQVYDGAKYRPSLQTSGHFQPGTDRLSEAALKARNQRIDRFWYEGTDLLGKSHEEVLTEAHQRKMAQKLGAIGDGRPQKPRDQYKPIIIEDANRMSVAEHAQPLLNMALAALFQALDEDGYYHRQNTAGVMSLTG